MGFKKYTFIWKQRSKAFSSVSNDFSAVGRTVGEAPFLIEMFSFSASTGSRCPAADFGSGVGCLTVLANGMLQAYAVGAEAWRAPLPLSL